uniref:Uncharacterized protein n=1 Tax=Arundo donax TaxID=35708 RepID=A0A0A9A8Y6_ARUDO
MFFFLNECQLAIVNVWSAGTNCKAWLPIDFSCQDTYRHVAIFPYSQLQQLEIQNFFLFLLNKGTQTDAKLVVSKDMVAACSAALAC